MQITDTEVLQALKKVESVKNDLDHDKITIDDVSEEYITILNLIYEIEISEVENNIARLNRDIEDYKVRMKNAIDYLKSKRR